jgi:hypothetical protein
MFGSGYNESAALMPELFDDYSHDEPKEVARLNKISQLRAEYKEEQKKEKAKVK